MVTQTDAWSKVTDFAAFLDERLELLLSGNNLLDDSIKNHVQHCLKEVKEKITVSAPKKSKLPLYEETTEQCELFFENLLEYFLDYDYEPAEPKNNPTPNTTKISDNSSIIDSAFAKRHLLMTPTHLRKDDPMDVASPTLESLGISSLALRFLNDDHQTIASDTSFQDFKYEHLDNTY